MRRILVVDDDPHICMAVTPGTTRCLRKPFKLTTLPGVIDARLSEAEPHGKYVAAAVANALSEPQGKTKRSNESSAEECFAV